jgi:hypothetical protein
MHFFECRYCFEKTGMGSNANFYIAQIFIQSFVDNFPGRLCVPVLPTGQQ